MNGKSGSQTGTEPVTAWEAALSRRLRSLPRRRAPAGLGRRIRAALSALEKEVNGCETTDNQRNRAGPRDVF